MRNVQRILRDVFMKKKTYVLIVLLVICVFAYAKFSPTITINPISEAKQMEQLERTKGAHVRSEFESDGCSGNISTSWTNVISELNERFPSFKENYPNPETLPFEPACVTHDQTYHQGDGGYIGRLRADNKLREDIIIYGIENTEILKKSTGLKTDEEVIFIYEKIAEIVYRGVRLGGAPCTGMPYAWGYGYNNGTCEE